MTTKEKLQSLAQNSIVLDISEELEDYAPCSTHFGGRPDVPADFAWPRYQGKGYNYECPERPLTFLAQFNCADFAAMDSDHLLPDYGLLSFFYEMDSEPWGFSPEDKGGLKVYWFEDLSTLVQAEFPEDMEEDFQFPAVGIQSRTIPAGMISSKSFRRKPTMRHLNLFERNWGLRSRRRVRNCWGGRTLSRTLCMRIASL